jgi:hypothetical protein
VSEKRGAGLPPGPRRKRSRKTVAEKPLYRVRGWDSIFENNRSREIKRTGWVPFPNSLDDDRYTQLVDHPEGPAHLGVLHAVLLAASRCNPRGTLIRDNGEPHDPMSLHRWTRLSESLIHDAMPRLVEITYLEIVKDEIPHQSAVSPHEAAGGSQHDARKEGKGTEGRDRTGTEVEGPDRTEADRGQEREIAPPPMVSGRLAQDGGAPSSDDGSRRGESTNLSREKDGALPGSAAVALPPEGPTRTMTDAELKRYQESGRS